MTVRPQLALLLLALSFAPLLPASEGVSRQEVLAAIQAAEASRGRTFPRGSCVSALQIGAPLREGLAEGFQVTEIKFDPVLRQARFLLRSKVDRKSPPFYAWCGFRSEAAGAPSAATRAVTLSGSSELQSLGPVLVDVHRAARLYLHAQNTAAVLLVKPLQSGHKDESVRVRLPLHGKMIEARVVGADALEATF